jgi:hypothetical protein
MPSDVERTARLYNGELAESDVAEHPRIRAYEKGDEHLLVDLLGGRVNREVALEHLRWKLLHWPSSTSSVWLATAGGKAVFHYGGIPLKYCIDGCIGTAMISVDAITAPDFRRRGLLTRGARRAFAEWQAHGVAFTLGLPNERWGSRVAATGWQKLFPLQWVVRPIRPEVFAARLLGLPWLRRATVMSNVTGRLLDGRVRKDAAIEFQEVTQADGCFDRLWDKCAANAPFAVVRDSSWVQWRFLSSPTRRYRVVLARRGGDAVGYCACHIAATSDKTSVFLAEVVGPNGDTQIQESLIAEAIENADAAGADVLATLAVPGTGLYKVLRRAGFFPGPAFAVHIVPFSAELSLDRLRKPENWQITGAEFDVV